METIWVDKDFNINGTLTSMTPEAYLYTRQRGEGRAPYLNVNGTVLLQNVIKHRIHVGVLKADEGKSMPKLENRTGASADAASQLLTAKTASTEMFVPCGENLLSATVPFSLGAEDGYILRKVGTAIYVSYGRDITAALCKGEAASEKTANVLGYYISFQDAVSAIDALRDKSAAYTIMLLKDAGSQTTPVTFNLPSYASSVTVMGDFPAAGAEGTADNADIAEAGERGNCRKIYYVNNISLKSSTVFRGVEFCPMTTRGAGAALGFTTGAFDLTFDDVSVGTEENGALAGMALSNLTGNTGRTVTVEDSSLEFTGNITSCGRLVIKDNEKEPDEKRAELTVKGNLNVQNLELMGEVTLDAKGTVTLTNVVNESTGENVQTNRIQYRRTTRDATNLTINGTISGSNENPLILEMMLPEGKAGGESA